MYIVTGGAGFIGSALVWKLNRMGETDILIVDSLGTSEKWKNLRNLRYRDYMEKDVFLERLQAGSFDMVKGILHMGACSSTTETDCRYLALNNYEYTKTLAEYALAKQIRFVYASSAATYGDGEQGYADDEQRLAALQPLNMYGYSKQMFDLYAQRHRWLDTIVGLKFFNVFGPNEYHKGDMRSVVHKAHGQIKTRGSVELFKSARAEYGDGEQQRDFVYIKDVVDKVAYFLEHREANGIYNIGRGEAETWNALVTAIFTALKLPVNINYIEMPEHLKAKYQYYTAADMSKFRALPGANLLKNWSLTEAVADYVQQYLEKNAHL
ncbi:MAG TPA: ADP-glyceromanno-heptose 6-epimerase [bacterium]|nr:ADP-glyceromanno-heptose 6-epimerase [bacterium]